MRTSVVAAMLLLAAFPIFIALLTSPDLNDDAYITLNYAKALGEGKGFVYNHPPATLGTTTPLFTLIMAATHALMPPLRMDRAAILFSALSWAAICFVLLYFRKHWRLSAWEAVAVAAVMMLFASYYGLGMEAYLFEFLLLLTCSLVFARRYLAAGAATGLLFLTRGEGILLAVAIPVWLAVQLRGTPREMTRALLRPLALMAAGGLCVLLPWFVYSQITFGGVLPDTFSAKMAQGQLGMPRFGQRTIERLARWGSFLPGLPHLTWVYHAIAIIGLVRVATSRPPFALPLLWAALYAATYTMLGIPYYWWYNLPLYNAWLLCIGLGIAWCLGIGRDTGSPRAGRLRIIAPCAGAVLLACMAGQTIYVAATAPGYAKATTYLQATEWIRENAPPDDLVATAEVGYPGFYLANPILDLWGLTSPHAIPNIRNMKLDATFWATPPDYYIYLDNDPPWGTIRNDPRFEKAYRPVASFEAPDPWKTCTIFKRNPGADFARDLHGPPGNQSAQVYAGRWNRSPESAAYTPEQIADFEALDAIGYLAGSVESSLVGGVTFHNPDKAWPGYNLYTSGHASEAVLMDMEGNPIHTWSYEFDQSWRTEFFPMRDNHPGMIFWRGAYPAKDGGLFAIFEGLGLIKVDRGSGLEWFHLNRAHHALAFPDDDHIYALSFHNEMIPRLHAERPIRDDVILVLDGAGNELRRVSLLKCFESSDYKHIVTNRTEAFGDIFHTNALYIVRGDEGVKHPAFQPGRVLISIFHMNTIALIDMDLETVVWAHQGEHIHQHDAELLDTGHLLLFDNAGRGGESRVMEYDVPDMSVTWSYPGDTGKPLRSPTCSSAQRLPNGNTLITESDPGRSLEVTPAGETVWEFHSPHRAGDQDEFVATLFDMRRYSREEIVQWFGGDPPGALVNQSAPASP